MTVFGLCFFGSVIMLCVLCMYFVDLVADIGQSRRNDDFLAFHDQPFLYLIYSSLLPFASTDVLENSQ